ncbi:hypothetical protein AAC387_Pa07g3360 [Persea americana]
MHFRNVVSWTALLTAYAENGEIGKAQKVFDEMAKRSVASWNAMIMAYIRSKRVSEAFGAVFEDAPLESCLLLCHDHGFCSGRDVKGSRERCGFLELHFRWVLQGKINDAREAFEKTPERNVVSWTAMVGGYLRAGMWEDGFGAFSRMRSEDVGINSTALTVIIGACATMDRFKQGIQIHCLVLKMGFGYDVL